MKVIIAGSREIKDIQIVLEAIKQSGFTNDITQVISGKCKKGVDTLGEKFAELAGLPVKPFPADWNKYGRGAGFVRNLEMADYADALIAVWDGESHGTKDMIDRAKAKGLKVYIHLVTGEEHGENYRAEGL